MNSSASSENYLSEMWIQFLKTLFRRSVRNRGCVISNRIWLLVLGSLRVQGFLSSYQIWPEMFSDVARSHFSTETAWKGSSASAAKFADKMLMCQIFCCLLFVLFCFFKFVGVFIQIHANLGKKFQQSSEIPLSVTCCQFTLGVTKSVNYFLSPFHCDASFLFLPFPPRHSSYIAPIVWKKFFCHLLWISSDINLTFEDRRLCREILYYLTC